VLVVADYSQMELRVAAQVARDPAMLRAYSRGEDLHKKTASAMTGVPVERVTPEQRSMAKAANFGMLFGMGPTGLAQYAASNYGVTMTAQQAARARAAFFASYPRLRQWQRATAQLAARTLKVTTPGGRVRDFRREKRGYRYTEALNTPIQGGAAEVLLATLGRLPGLLAGLDARLVNVVHDEIVLEVSEHDASEAKARLEEAMRGGMLEIFPDATTTGLVEANIAANWGDAK
jgi:DNA polymerase-1